MAQKWYSKASVQGGFVAAAGVVIAAVIYVAVPRVWPEPYPQQFELTPDAIFGGLSDSENPAVLMLNDVENDKKLVELFNTAQIQIKIVTVTGSSWLLTDHLRTPFEDAMKRPVRIDMLVFDYSHSPFFDFVQQATVLQGRARMSRADYAENLKRYSPFLSEPSYNFSLSLYKNYPWIRFSIYDEKAVSFVCIPTMRSGARVKKFYSEDQWVIRCFNQIFSEFKRDALQLENPEALQNYIKSQTRD